MPIIALAALLLAAAAPSGPEPVPFNLPDYASVERIAAYASPEEYRVAAGDRRFRLEKVAYASDSLRVYAYLYGPARAGAKLPGVVFNRGSVVRGEFAAEHLVTFHRFAQAGFVVIAPLYRQSGGGEGRDEMGGADVGDLMRTLDLVRALGTADTERLFMCGESRGGMMTFQAIRDGYPLRAAAVWGAFTDLGALLAATPRFREAAAQLWPDYPAKLDEIARRRSALAWADQLEVPLLIMHGGADKDVPPAQSLALAARLQALGKPYELIVRAGANHILSEWRAQRDALIVEWFRRHVDTR
jgi:dipeptidyl aminopeptidase/acylaminoacyl peptidase